MSRFTFFFIFVSLVAFHQANALQVSFYPGDQVFLNDANARRNTHDLIAHLLVVKNDSNETITLKQLKYQLFAGDRLVQEVYLSTEDLVLDTAELIELNSIGMEIMANVICPAEALGTDTTLASSSKLESGQALTARNVYITVQAVPTRLRIEAIAEKADGQEVKASSEVKVAQYESANKYIFPLEGSWYMQAVPNVTSHHRWMFQTEFGIDFLKTDEKGSLYKTNKKKLEDYYAYSQTVLAAADGVVVKVINDAKQDWDLWFPREGESEEAFETRSQKAMLELMKKDLYRAVTGNLVIIEHPNQEYSGYAHLKTGSVTVNAGDRVKQGQKIGEVGDTGDWYQPHLHFQISDQPDVLRGRSLPFTFVDVQSNVELGHFARKK
jgi:murein DD-endopeptidase MepM/ murein hydrolase activator NlpD